jgi:hypothetical protein
MSLKTSFDAVLVEASQQFNSSLNVLNSFRLAAPYQRLNSALSVRYQQLIITLSSSYQRLISALLAP